MAARKKKKIDIKKTLKGAAIKGGIAAGISALISWYVSSFLHLLMKSRQVVANPFAFFRMYKFHKFPTTLFFLLFLVVFCFIVYTLLKSRKANANMDKERNFQYSESGVYGTAKLITEIDDVKDVADSKGSAEAMGTILGQLDQSGEELITMHNDMRINKHICVFGASQSGKSHCFVLPYALQAARRRESLIVTDPKGELYSKTAEYFKSLGYVVRRFDLKNPGKSDGWDCLKEITNSDVSPELRAQIFAHTVISNIGGNENLGDVHTGGPFMLLMSLLLRVALDPSFEERPEGRTFSAVLECLNNPSGAEYLDKELFGEGGEGEGKVPESAYSALTMYRKFKAASANLYGNIITGLNSNLAALSSPEIQALISRDDIDLTLPGKRPCVYYCVMSDMHGALNFLGALFFSFLFLNLAEFADSQPNQKCPVPVNFLLDEFRNIGSIPGFDQKIAVVRSRAINISIILQDIAQLRSRYPNCYSSIMSNCATHLCIGFNDEETETYYSKLAGEATAKVRTDQHEKFEPLINLGHKHSSGDGRRSIFTRDELHRMDPDECLISIQYHDCMKAFKFPVTSHPEFKYLIPCSVDAYPYILNAEARNRLRAEESNFLEKYDKWLNGGHEPIPNLKGKDYEKIRKAYLSRSVVEIPQGMSKDLFDNIGYLDAMKQIAVADRLPGPPLLDDDILDLDALDAISRDAIETAMDAAATFDPDSVKSVDWVAHLERAHVVAEQGQDYAEVNNDFDVIDDVLLANNKSIAPDLASFDFGSDDEDIIEIDF